MAENRAALYEPLGLLAELTHRCPLGCPYCSNPLALDPRGSELDTQTWARVFTEAAALGVLQVHLSGGEPGARRDLVAIMAAAHAAGLYTNLITSAVGITLNTLRQLAEAGLDHVQISIQDSERASADRMACDPGRCGPAEANRWDQGWPPRRRRARKNNGSDPAVFSSGASPAPFFLATVAISGAANSSRVRSSMRALAICAASFC